MLSFLKHTSFLIVSSVILIGTILINFCVGIFLLLPAFMAVGLKCSSGNEISFLCFISNKTGIFSLLLLASCLALYIAVNNLLPSKFLPKDVNSVLSLPLFPIGILCTITGLFSFYASGAQIFLSMPNLLSGIICFLYVVLQYKT